MTSPRYIKMDDTMTLVRKLGEKLCQYTQDEAPVRQKAMSGMILYSPYDCWLAMCVCACVPTAYVAS